MNSFEEYKEFARIRNQIDNGWYKQHVKRVNDDFFKAGIDVGDIERLLWAKNPEKLSDVEVTCLNLCTKHGIVKSEFNPHISYTVPRCGKGGLNSKNRVKTAQEFVVKEVNRSPHHTKSTILKQQLAFHVTNILGPKTTA